MFEYFEISLENPDLTEKILSKFGDFSLVIARVKS